MVDLFSINVLAKREAKKAVKRDLEARGVRVFYVPAREIAALAKEYLLTHRAELIAEATEEWKAISKPYAQR